MFRLATVHPLFSHFTIGALPLIVLSYAMAVWRRSSAWTFVGDVCLCVTAVLTVGTATFGLVSDATVPWPGGLERWRAWHLYLGVGSGLGLVAAAVYRWVAARRGATAGVPLLVFVGAIAAGLGATGWIGGEVLVYHSGMAVTAAADGALAPPVPALPLSSAPASSPPPDFLSTMREVRAHWAEINTRVARMAVHLPRDQDFEDARASAARLHELADRMSDIAPPGASHDQIVSMAQGLDGGAQEIEEAAAKKDLPAVSRALGDMTATCIECHKETRTRRR